MDYIAKIIQERQDKSKLFWKYNFVDLQTKEEDCFLSDYQIDYLPSLAGKLKLSRDKTYQSFDQEIDNTAEGFKHLETLIQLEREWKNGIKEAESDFAKKKKIKLTSQKIFELREKGLSWKWIRDFCGVSEWTIRRWKKEELNRPKQKRGRKLKINGFSLALLHSFITKNNTLKQQEMVNYLFQQLGLKVDQSTVSRTLKREKITYKKATVRYSEQKSRMKEIINFANYFKFVIFPCEEVLALDECSFHLNEAPRWGYSRKGLRTSIWKPGNKGNNYTLILCIKNVANQGVIHYELIEEGVRTKSFHDFLAGIKLPDNNSHYLWMDNLKVHHATYSCQKLGLPTVEEQLIQKKIYPKFLPPYTPQLNPVELCFNIIKQYEKRYQPRTFEELKSTIDKAIVELQKKDLSQFFWHCLNFNFC